MTIDASFFARTDQPPGTPKLSHRLNRIASVIDGEERKDVGDVEVQLAGPVYIIPREDA